MSVTKKSLLLVLGIVLGSVAVACSSSEPEVAATGTTSDSADSTGTSAASSEATSNQPAWVTDALEQQETIRYVANSGGVGVSHRSACEDAARIDGVWPEGAELEIVLSDEPDCADWTLLSDGTITSWVRNKYLASTTPATAGSGTASTGTSSATAQIEVINFFGNLIPTAQLRVRPLSYTYNNAVFVSGCDKSWHPIGDSAIALSGKVIADPDPNSCGFGVLSLVPAYWVTVNR